MEYLGEIIWYLSLPAMVWIAVHFVIWNLEAFEDIHSMENSETLNSR